MTAATSQWALTAARRLPRPTSSFADTKARAFGFSPSARWCVRQHRWCCRLRVTVACPELCRRVCFVVCFSPGGVQMLKRHTALFASVIFAIATAATAQDWAKATLEKSPRHGEWVQIKNGDRTVHAFIVYPESKKKAPAVVVIH